MLTTAVLWLSASLLGSGAEVEVEEVVATCRPPNNGAGPLWCYGAPLIVRQGDLVCVSVMETGEGVPPLSNTRWRLFRRDERGWKLVRRPDGFRHREPCPLVGLGDGRLALSVNPSTEPPGTQYGRCDPHLLVFDTRRIDEAPVALRPAWPKGVHFTDHSYRGIAADAARGEVLVLNIDATTSLQHWAFGSSDGGFSRTGAIAFPIRACYPQVTLRDRAAHVMAIGDIVEPNASWRAFKKQKTGRAWDYVFRRLFYTMTPDITRTDFAPPLEVDTVEATAGHITNLDLRVGPGGTAHLLYLKTDLTPTLRNAFFPGRPIVTTLEHVEIEAGKVARRTTLAAGGEGARETPHYARFHVTEDGTLWVVEFVTSVRDGGRSFVENRIFPIRPGGSASPAVSLALKTPLSTFFTAPERGGSRPSNTLDLFGTGGDGQTLRYARVRMPSP
jgi:hypothetical protein